MVANMLLIFINLVFFLNHCFHFVIYPKRLPIVKNFGFIWNEICHDIKNGFIRNRYLLICTLVRKNSFIVELGYADHLHLGPSHAFLKVVLK